MTRYVTIALIGVILSVFDSGCHKKPSSKSEKRQEPVTITTSEFKGVIFPSGWTDIIFDDERTIDGYWTPREKDILAAEAGIQDFMKASEPEIFKRLHQYGRQYFGVIVDGRKRVYCNFFIDPEEHPYWKSSFVLVLDGGANYFRIEYDVDSKKCLNFHPNGEA
ncbi:hypothetical protein ES703_94818 [subsurface metagenome]